MNFRAKLIFLVVLANLLLGGMVWQLVTGAQAIKKQVKIFIPAIGYLQGISSVSSTITLQTKEILGYLISQNTLDKDKFIENSRNLEEYFLLWRQSAAQQQALGIEGEDDDLALAGKTFAIYQQWHKSMSDVIALTDKGEWNTALQMFRENWSSSIEIEILPAIDIALNDGLIEVEEAYHGLLLTIGTIPWGAEKNAVHLEKIHTSMNFLIGGNQLNASVNTQFAMLVDYLLYDDEKSLQHFYRSQVISDKTLIFWADIAEKKSQLGTELSETASQQIENIKTNYQRFLQQATGAIALKKSGQINAALAIIVGDGNRLISDFHDGTTQAINEGADSLLTRVAAFHMTGIILLVVFLSASSLLSILMVKNMLFSLKSLSSGMGAIRSGDLDHRIVLRKDEDMGKLAQAFNTMMDSLCQTQDSLEQLTAELEQRVDERTAQLAAANQDLEAFNAMVSHDLRSPLTAISGYSQLLLLKHNKTSPLETENTLEKIVVSTEAMSRIVSSLESLSQASHEQLERETVDLNAMATKFLAHLSATEPQRKVEILIKPTVAAIGDRNLLEIVLTNLLGNAWKYSSKTDRAIIEFGDRVQAGKQLWYIRDNGVGFDMKNLDRLFKAFGRLHSNKDFSGTGIGLSTVQRIIHRHGGEIWAEAVEGQGATFYFHFGQPT